MAAAGEDAATGWPYGRPMESTTTIWALGDYHRFAKDLIWNFGPTLVAACGISPGQRVLDVAAGTGNVAIRAAQAGASVVASDLEPAQFEAGRREAQACGVELEWVQADAAALPFAVGEFDVVTSSAGAIFAPDHQAVADELVRVCRPGGTIGMLTFTPEGMAGEFFELFGRYAPPSDGRPPILWGVEEHVRELFGDRVSLRFTRDTYVERRPGGPQGFLDFYKQTFGPVVAIYVALAQGDGHGVHAGVGFQLAHGIADVGLDRLARQHEPLGDVLTRQPLREQVHDLPLALGKRRHPPCGLMREQRRAQPRVHVGAAVGDRLQRAGQLVWGALLERVAARAGVQAADQQLDVARPRVEHDAKCRPPRIPRARGEAPAPHAGPDDLR
jgi:SAM-dependent methyltransferase